VHFPWLIPLTHTSSRVAADKTAARIVPGEAELMSAMLPGNRQGMGLAASRTSTTGLKPFAGPWKRQCELAGSRSAIAIGLAEHGELASACRDTRTLSVLWEDGHGTTSTSGTSDWRADARSYSTRERRPSPCSKSVRPDVTPRTITSVGHYGHHHQLERRSHTGIYSFDHLRPRRTRRSQGCGRC